MSSTTSVPIYLLHGEDDYRVYLHKRQVLQSLQQGQAGLKRIDVVEGDDLETLFFARSLFQEPKLLVLDLKKNYSNLEQCLDPQAIERINPQISMVFFLYGKLDKRLKLSKLLDKVATHKQQCEAFKPWKAQDIQNWLQEHAKAQSIEIEKAAIQKLVEFYAADTAALDNELQRLHLLLPGQAISLKSVVEHCQIQHSIFQLFDSLLQARIGEASQILQQICAPQDSPLPLLSALQTFTRNAILSKNLQEQGKSPQQIAELLKAHPWKIQQDLQKLQKHSSQGSLWRLLQTLNSIEASIKQGLCFSPLLFFRFRLLALAAKNGTVSQG